MPHNALKQSGDETDGRVAPADEPHTVIVFGAHRLPIAVESLNAESDDQAMHLASKVAATHLEAYGYEMWFNGIKLASYFSQTALCQNGHTHPPATLRHHHSTVR